MLIFVSPAVAAEGSHNASGSEGNGKPEHTKMRAHGQFSFSPLDFKDQLQLSEEQQEKLEPIQTQYKKHPGTRRPRFMRRSSTWAPCSNSRRPRPTS